MINEKPKQIPQSSGVYFFKNSAGEIIYVGKAGNLKNRLASYFNRSKKEPKTQKMLDEAESIDWQEFDSEIEALIVEAEQIKFHEPKYNIALRDGKQYSYVAFSEDAFQKIYVTHQLFTDENIESYIGPFTDARALHSTLAHLRRIFRFCTCAQKHNQYCLNYHIGKCFGYCCLKNPTVTDEQYRQYKDNIKAIKDLLNGKKKLLIKEIENEMKVIAGEEDFEKAIELRDKLEKIKNIFENAKVIKEISKRTDAIRFLERSLNLANKPRRIEGYDISNIQGKYATGSMVVFTDGNPDKNEYRKFRIRITGKSNDTAMLREVLSRRFKHPEWQYPDLIIIDGGKAQLNAAISSIQGSTLKLPIIVLTKNEKHIGDHIYLSNPEKLRNGVNKKSPIPLKKLPELVKNLILHIDQESHRFAIEYYRKLHRQSI